jgi:hypothetical protein
MKSLETLGFPKEKAQTPCRNDPAIWEIRAKGGRRMTTTTMTNDRPRKSLAEQLDRLDAILDGLSDALQGAVADAVQHAVGLAVKDAVQGVLSELLANPAVLAMLRGPTTPTSPEGPPAATAPSPVRERLAGLAGRAKAFGLKVSGVTAGVGRRLLAALRPWLPCLAALALGVASGLAYAVGWPLVAAAWAAGLVGRLANWSWPASGLVAALGTCGSY